MPSNPETRCENLVLKITQIDCVVPWHSHPENGRRSRWDEIEPRGIASNRDILQRIISDGTGRFSLQVCTAAATRNWKNKANPGRTCVTPDAALDAAIQELKSEEEAKRKEKIREYASRQLLPESNPQRKASFVTGPPTLLPSSMLPLPPLPPPRAAQRPHSDLPPLCNLQQAVQKVAPRIQRASPDPVPCGHQRSERAVVGDPRFPESYNIRNERIELETHFYCTGCALAYTSAAFDNHKSRARHDVDKQACTGRNTKQALPLDIRIIDAIARRAYREARVRVLVWAKTGSSELPGDDPLPSSSSDSSAVDLAAPLSVHRKRMERQVEATRSKKAADAGSCRPHSMHLGEGGDDSDSDSDDVSRQVFPSTVPGVRPSSGCPVPSMQPQPPVPTQKFRGSTRNAQMARKPEQACHDKDSGTSDSPCTDELFGTSMQSGKEAKSVASQPVFRNNPVTTSHVICRYCGLTYSPQAFMNHKSEVRGLIAGNHPLKHYSAKCVTPGPRLHIPTDNDKIMGALSCKDFSLARLLCYEYAVSLGDVLMGAC
jgi:hypothetical protein